MLTYELDNNKNVPKYIYLYQLIKEDIISGKLKEKEKLPSKRTLAKHLNIGIITVATAYDQLVAEGYVKSEERKGYFVQENISEFIKNTNDVKTTIVETEEREVSADFHANRINLKLFPVSVWNQLMRKTLYLNDKTLFQTVPYNGLLELREAIADYLHDCRGMTVSPSQIIIGAGTEYLYSRIVQLFGRAYTFGFEEPGYKKLATIVNSYGNPCEYIPVDDMGLNVEELEESGADIVHVSPSNQFPIGAVMPISRRQELLEWANKVKKRYIIEDDYDSEFRYKGTYIAPLFTADKQDKVIYMNTFSKTLVPSFRISYMVLPPKLLEKYVETMSFYSCTVSSFEQHTLAHFISEGYFERHINRLRNYYSAMRKKILEAIKKSKIGEISEIIEYGSGTHFLLSLVTSAKEEDIQEAMELMDVHIRRYSDYCTNVPEFNPSNYIFVVNYAGITEDKLPEMISRLEQIFPECRGDA